MFLPTDITLRPGDSGDYVAEMQRRLILLRLLGENNKTSVYDEPSTYAVRRFQGMHGLRTDGIAGPETLIRLANYDTMSSDERDAGDAGTGDKRDDPKLQMSGEFMMQQVVGVEAVDPNVIEGLHDVAGTEASTDPRKQENAPGQKTELQRDMQQQVLQQMQHTDPVLSQERIAQRSDSQIVITKDGIQARSVMDDLNDKTIVATEKPSDRAADSPAAKAAENAKSLGEAAPLPPPPSAETVAVATPALAKPLSPELARTEQKLDTVSREETKQEGQKLDGKGVRSEGQSPNNRLGEMSPSMTPTTDRGRGTGVNV